jgi:multidrug efflux pump subunit AcrB
MPRFNLSAWAVKHQAFVLFLIIAMSIAGVGSYLQLGRAEDPSFTIKVMVIQAFWPGATAAEMQSQVADRIEKRLQELPYFDYVKTYSRPGMTVLQPVLKEDVPARRVPDIWYQTRKKSTDIKKDLPEGVIGPAFNDEYGDVFSAVYMISGDGLSLAELKDYAETARQRLLSVRDVAKVDIVGNVDQRIYIEYSYQKLSTLGISPLLIIDSIRKQNAMAPAGFVETGADRVYVRVSGAFTGVDAVAAVPVEDAGRTFRLGDITDVKRGYEDPPGFLVRHQGKPAVGVVVAMADGGNVLELGVNLGAAIKELRSQIPIGVEIEQIADQPKVVEESVGEFLKSFLEALIIVLVVSFLSLGWRTGIVVAIAVPLVLAIVFVVMDATSMNLDRISLGALIIALGLLVDDAIIAVEMMVVKMEQGLDRVEAASFAWTSTAFPMLTGTLVTAAGFLPVGFAKSTAGEYAGGIFWVVGLSLVISWFVAVIFTPYLGVKLLPQPSHAGHDGAMLHASRPYRVLRSAVSWSVGHRKTVIVVVLCTFALAGVGFGFVQQQFFPTSERPELFIELRLPEGSAIGATEKAARQAEELLIGDRDVKTYTTYIGAGSPRFFLSLNAELPDERFALVVIMTTGPEGRERLKARLERAIADGAVPGARVRVDRLNFGPPVGFPVQFRLIGPDPSKLREIGAEVRQIMRQNPNARDVQFDWNEQAKAIRLEVDQDRARALGLTPQEISFTLQALLSGYKIAEYRERIDLIPVVARATLSERLNLDGFADLTIPTRGGVRVPLSQIARIHHDFEDPILWRRNREYVLTVRADVTEGVQPPTVSQAILGELKGVIEGLPAGYRIEVGGSIEESAKANTALYKVFPVMFLVMLTLLMTQLQSFSKLFLVFSTAPLGLIGATAFLLAFDAPFGFTALLGLIALGGMIMRNTVILVDQIDEDRRAGLSQWEAIIESTIRRSRPVVLTALAAILAMIPLSRSVFFGPMAITLMGGLLVGTVLTLLFLPALYAFWFGVQKREDAAVPPADGERTTMAVEIKARQAVSLLAPGE